jgi:hypothetical protein
MLLQLVGLTEGGRTGCCQEVPDSPGKKGLLGQEGLMGSLELVKFHF